MAISIGAIANTLFGKKIKQEKLFEERIEQLSSTIAAKASEAKSLAVARVAEKLPKGGSPEELRKEIEKSIQIRGDLILNNVNQGEISFVQDLVNGYHQQALSQAKIQFWFSVIAATVGFIYILISASGAAAESANILLKILPGVVIDAVALLFFRQAEQTRERATALYDRLRTDNQMEKAKELVNSIEDIQIKSAVKAQMALHMAGLKPKEIDLPTFLTEKEK